MISRLSQTSMSFGATLGTSPREAYDSLMNKNVQTSQNQIKVINNMSSTQANNQIPMQGTGQKLDVVA